MAQVSSKREAQERVDRIRAFQRELQELAREGALVLLPEQRAGLGAHIDRTLQELASGFDVDISESQKQISLGMRIVSALGGLAFCAAVFFFFYRFWGGLSTPVQLTVLIATPIVGLLAMDWISRRERTLYYTSLIGLVVLAAFALDLVELGDIFNIIPSPSAFLAWSVLAFILAYTYRLRLPLVGALIAIAVYLASVVTILAGYLWAADVRPENYLAAGAAMLVLPGIVRHKRVQEFPPIYRIVGLLIIFLSLWLLAVGRHLSWLPLGVKPIHAIYQTGGFLLAGASIWTGIRGRLPWAVNLGSAFFAIYLFNQMFTWWWDWMPKYIFFFIMGAIALALLAVFRRIRVRISQGQPA